MNTSQIAALVLDAVRETFELAAHSPHGTTIRFFADDMGGVTSLQVRPLHGCLIVQVHAPYVTVSAYLEVP